MDDSAPKSSGLQNVAILLREIGYRAQVDPGDDEVIRSAAGGWKIALQFTDETLGVRCYLEGKDSHIQLRHVNEFNASYRFAKIYLDDEGDIVLGCDFLFNAAKDDVTATLREVMTISEESIGALKDLFRAARNETEAAPSAGESQSSTAA